MPNAARVGALVVVAILMVFGLNALLGQSLFPPKVETYFAEVDDASGVRSGSPVLLAGVTIGTVSEVRVVENMRARIAFVISRDQAIPTDSTIEVPTSLIGLGETPVKVLPGRASNRAAPGTTFLGKKASPLQDILPGTEETLAELEKTLTAVRKLLEDRQLLARVDKLMATSDATIASFGSLADEAKIALRSNQSTIRRLLEESSATLANVKRITGGAAEFVDDPRLKQEAFDLLAQAHNSAKKVDLLLGDVRALLNDPKLRSALDQSAANLTEITESGRRAAKDGEVIVKNASTVSENAVELSARANELAAKASTIADGVQSLVDRASNFFDRSANVGPRIGIQSGMDLVRETEPGRWRTDFLARLEFRDSLAYLGVYDAFERNALTFQVGNKDPVFAYRYGVYAGKPGVGVDYSLAPRVSARGDLWNLNDPRLDLRATYSFGNGVLGWVGLDRVFRDNVVTFGVGIRR